MPVHRKATLFLVSTLVLCVFSIPAGASPAGQLMATVQPTVVLPGGTVSYTISLVNEGTTGFNNLSVTHHLPAGFSYVAGTSALRVNGGPASTADPVISGNQLTWSLANLRAAQSDWFYGIHTFIQDSCDNSHIDSQLNAARSLMGAGAFVKQLFYGITTGTTKPYDCWVYFVNRAYDLGLQPVVRLEGSYGTNSWVAPPADSPGNYATIAAAFQRVVSGLPRRDGHSLFVEIWNEPNLNIEWSDAPDPAEYAHFLLDVSQAIRALGDPRIVILNGGLAPGGDINHLDFIDGMATVPGALEAFDIWASHPYPANHPPDYNIHDGTALYTVATIDTYMLELDRLAQHGRPGLQVLLTETGYNLGNNVYGFEGYAPVGESNRADFITRAFRDDWSIWPEVLGVTPFELVDPHNHWPAFDWLYPNGIHHQQYDAVAALGKSAKLLPTQLTVTFRARSTTTTGTYYSQLTAAAANATIAGTGNIAPVTVALPTPTPTATPQPTATPTATATPIPCGAFDFDQDGSITVADIMTVAVAWNSQTGDPKYSIAIDFDRNGQIDVLDIMRVAGHWGEACTLIAARVPAPPIPWPDMAGLRAITRDPQTGRLLGINQTDLVTLDTPLTRYPLGSDLRDLATGHDGRTLYISDAAAGHVLAFDLQSGRVRGQVTGLDAPTGIAAGRRGLWVSERAAGRLALVNLNNYDIIGHIPVGTAPGGLVYDDVAGQLYVAVTGEGVVAVVNDNGTVHKRWPVGGIGLPQGMALDSPERRLYVSYAVTPRDGAIAVYDLSRNQRTDTWRGALFSPLDPLLTLALGPSRGQLIAVGSTGTWSIDSRTGAAMRQDKPK